MTNEQLAASIQAGDAPELLPILWERTKRYLYKLAGRAYSAYKESCDRAGIVMDDLRQGCYEAFLQAVGAVSPFCPSPHTHSKMCCIASWGSVQGAGIL